MKKTLRYLLLLAWACTLSENNDAPAPQANFQIRAKDKSKRFIKIKNLSQYVVETRWDFGDDTQDTAFNPTHTYDQPGHYIIKLTAKGARLKGTDEHSIEVSFLDISISQDRIKENLAVGTLLATLNTVPDGQNYTYSLVNIGDNDNTAFRISNNQIFTNQVFDFETQKEYKIYIKSQSGSIQDENVFTIHIINTIEPPTTLTLSNNTITENQIPNTIIGTFRAVDKKFSEKLTYALVSGIGDTDNGTFIITDSTLKAKDALNFEAKALHQIRVQVEDKDKNSFQKSFTIQVTDVEDNPTDILISRDNITENQAVNSTVAHLSTIDSDIRANHTYTLLTGGTNFNIKDGTLQTSEVFDYEAQNSYTIKIRTVDDDGQMFDKTFIIKINDVDEPLAAFVSKWRITIPNERITIPTTGSGYKYTIDWGDGTVERNKTGDASHTYTTPDIYTISIEGIFPRIYFNNPRPTAGDNSTKIISIQQWGNTAWVSMNRAFQGTTNLQVNAIDNPDFSELTDLSFMFANATAFNSNIGRWNVAGITHMKNMFAGATAFNGDISSWNVGRAVNLDSMFAGASTFNTDIRGWKVDSVVSMQGMFAGAAAFNIDIRSWTVSKVTNMKAMFQDAAAFDQNLSAWEIANATNMADMFTNITLSISNYDAILNAWSSRPSENNVTFGAGNSKYSSVGEAGRNILLSRGWTITDGGKTP